MKLPLPIFFYRGCCWCAVDVGVASKASTVDSTTINSLGTLRFRSQLLPFRGHRWRETDPLSIPLSRSVGTEIPKHIVNLASFETGVESDPVQPQRLHAASIWHELHRDPAGADPRQLPHPQDLLLRPAVLGGGTAAGVQALPTHHKAGGAGGPAAAARGYLEIVRSLSRTPTSRKTSVLKCYFVC